jgi:hypothetical protein
MMTQSKNKYGNKKVIIDDISFDSKLEAAHYKILKEHPNVEIVELQPKYVLQEKFKYYDETIRKITYKPDFKFWFNDELHILDSKGMKTQQGTMREKMFKKHIIDNDLNMKFIVVKNQKDLRAYLNGGEE